MAGRTKRLAKAAVMLATSAAVENVVRKAAANPRVRRKALEVGAAAGAKAVAVGKAAGREVGKKLRAPRKAAGKKIKELGKLVAG
jgi:hypothetical protein